MARRVMVVGAQGFLGGFLARAFADEGWRVTRAGRRPESGADFRLVNLDRPETLRDAFGEVDLVVSTVRHPGLHAERAVLGQGPILLNLDDLPATERAALKRQAPNPDGLVVDRCGLYGLAMLALVEILRIVRMAPLAGTTPWNGDLDRSGVGESTHRLPGRSFPPWRRQTRSSRGQRRDAPAEPTSGGAQQATHLSLGRDPRRRPRAGVADRFRRGRLPNERVRHEGRRRRAAFGSPCAAASRTLRRRSNPDARRGVGNAREAGDRGAEADQPRAEHPSREAIPQAAAQR